MKNEYIKSYDDAATVAVKEAAINKAVESRLEDLRHLPLNGQPSPAQLAEFAIIRIFSHETNAKLQSGMDAAKEALKDRSQVEREQLAESTLLKFALNGKLAIGLLKKRLSQNPHERAFNREVVRATLARPELKDIVQDLYDQHGYEVTDQKSLMDTIINAGNKSLDDSRAKKKMAKGLMWSLFTDSAKVLDEREFTYMVQPKGPQHKFG